LSGAPGEVDDQKQNDGLLSLAPVSFEDALAAALETPPERKPKKKVKGEKPKA
jgi:hypothetical protein